MATQHLNIELLPALYKTAFSTPQRVACAREGYRAAKHFQLTNEGTAHGYAYNSPELNAFRVGEAIYNIEHMCAFTHKEADSFSPHTMDKVRGALGLPSPYDLRPLLSRIPRQY